MLMTGGNVSCCGFAGSVGCDLKESFNDKSVKLYIDVAPLHWNSRLLSFILMHLE